MMHALDLHQVGQAVASYAPVDVFRCSGVSSGWRDRWSREDVFVPSLTVDCSGRGSRIRACEMAAIAQRMSCKGLSVDLKFSGCRIG